MRIVEEKIVKASDCIFCKIADGEIPSKTIYEDEWFRVVLDVSPASKGHALILPKDHYKDLTELPMELAQKVIPLAQKIGVAMMKSLKCPGFNLVQNNGIAAGQTVFHFHMHVIPAYESSSVILSTNPSRGESETLEQIAEIIKAAI